MDRKNHHTAIAGQSSAKHAYLISVQVEGAASAAVPKIARGQTGVHKKSKYQRVPVNLF
jgi:hypothetical protein